MSRRRLVASLTAIACSLALAATLAVWTFPLKAAPRAAQDSTQSGVAQGAGAAGPKIVVTDLKIEGDVTDVEGARARILKGLEGHEFDSNSRWLDNITEVNIRAEFQNRGYLKVMLSDSRAERLDSEKHNMLVSIHVDEGGQYKTGDISIVSDDSAHALVIPEAELRQQFQLQAGDLFDVDAVRKGLTGIARLYQLRGYADAKVGPPKLSIDDKNYVVTATVQVREGSQTSPPPAR